MEALHESINRMNSLLDELVKISRQLRDVSKQVISEEELLPLQKHQEDLLKQIEKIDEVLNQYEREIEPSIHNQFHKKLAEFQALNQEFISNLTSSHGVIQFDLKRIQDELLDEDLPHFHLPRSTDILPSTDEHKASDPNKKPKKN
ncbi:MAG: hypothetical protein H0W88_08545 [Parachlamydiaceae bacterium]|nr:hypothetical protein [Parachlamydiaceae bacterium]